MKKIDKKIYLDESVKKFDEISNVSKMRNLK